MMSVRTLRIMRWAQFAGLPLGAFSLASPVATESRAPPSPPPS